jgi:hypothetical protein
MEEIGTTPGKEEVEQRQEQLSRVESGTETEKTSGTSFPDRVEERKLCSDKKSILYKCLY